MKHFRDPGTSVTYVSQGEYAVSGDEQVVMTTVLGSCVAACLFDEQAGVGGMNHFLLPGVDRAHDDANLLGVNLMELLINNLLRLGADKRRLKAKLFGGGRVIAHGAQIGEKNAIFARRFMADEGIACTSESLGGESGRRIRFWPTTGRAQQAFIKDVRDEPPARAPKPVDRPADDIELF